MQETSGDTQPATRMPDRISHEKGDLQQESSFTRDVEIAPAEEQEKSYYSKLSVWLMVLFSGLAIGSDG